MGSNSMLSEVGLTLPSSWFVTIGWAAAWTALMLAYSPFADWMATKLFVAPPTLGPFHAIQESRVKLLIGIVVAWLLGGFLEELVFSRRRAESRRIGPGAACVALDCDERCRRRCSSRRRNRPLVPGATCDGDHHAAFGAFWSAVRRKWSQSLGRDSLPRLLRHDRVCSSRER